MHGSPLAKYDNKIIWEKYKYFDLGIIGEPYYDIDFNEIFYLTDTGRRWDGKSVSVRDKVEQPKRGKRFQKKIKSTRDIITFVNDELLPRQMMINVHPQRWNSEPIPWITEFIWQNIKNVGKST